ncbi:hypothetical protein SAMD00023353_2300870 [Rosellinia necatrix]|uniref:Receptor L-domain domain-containing protein n=1 Tax=Rosellinia necatrix TaxID=77044 RepID=A0A1W2TGE6_ROSNE|nr:hypothetical protein SAMD00023353_2300870 [Rosellinia necatrix]
MDSSCVLNQVVTVTSQDDIDHGPLSNCTTSIQQIDIRNATGTLKFIGAPNVGNLTVRDCPGLQVLDIPDTYRLGSIDITGPNNLTNVSIPPQCFYDIFSLALFDIGNGDSGWQNSESFGFTDLTTAEVIETDSCLSLRALETIFILEISAGSRCYYDLKNLESISYYKVTGANGFFQLSTLLKGGNVIRAGDVPNGYERPLMINNSMILDSSVLQGEEGPSIVPKIITIGSDFNITSNSNINLTFDPLTEIGAGLFVYNNTNCGFTFDKVTTIGSLVFIDNINTSLPWFPSLKRADDIHLRGYIDTSVGPNIFPALEIVPGSVIIEPWNDDFDCSKLVQYQSDHIIHNLSCNGTNNGTNSGTDTISRSSNGALSQGAWAGIGVSIGVVVIGIVGGLLWLYIHFKRQLRKLGENIPPESRKSEVAEDSEEPQTAGLQEADGIGMAREKPAEHIVELPTRPTELPTSP